MAMLALGLAIFLGAHAFVMQRKLRAGVIGRIGEPFYKILFAVVALAGFVLLLQGFVAARAVPPLMLWDPPLFGRHITMLLVLLAAILLPATYINSHIRATVKHPMIIAVIAWSLGHLLVRGDSAAVLLFGSFLVWGVIARVSMAKRSEHKLSAAAAAPDGWRNDALVVVLGIVLYVAIFGWLHQALIGIALR